MVSAQCQASPESSAEPTFHPTDVSLLEVVICMPIFVTGRLRLASQRLLCVGSGAPGVGTKGKRGESLARGGKKQGTGRTRRVDGMPRLRKLTRVCIEWLALYHDDGRKHKAPRRVRMCPDFSPHFLGATDARRRCHLLIDRHVAQTDHFDSVWRRANVNVLSIG